VQLLLKRLTPVLTRDTDNPMETAVSKITRKTPPVEVAKPCPDFPLFPHATGRPDTGPFSFTPSDFRQRQSAFLGQIFGDSEPVEIEHRIDKEPHEC
jgi:hypothetical protein